MSGTHINAIRQGALATYAVDHGFAWKPDPSSSSGGLIYETSIAERVRKGSRDIETAKSEKDMVVAIRDLIFDSDFGKFVSGFFKEEKIIKPELKWNGNKVRTFVEKLGTKDTGYLIKLKEHTDLIREFSENLLKLGSSSDSERKELLNGIAKTDTDKKKSHIFELLENADKSVTLDPEIHEALSIIKSIRSELSKDNALDDKNSAVSKKWEKAIGLINKHKADFERDGSVTNAITRLEKAHSDLESLHTKYKDTKAFVEKDPEASKGEVLLETALSEIHGLSDSIILASHVMPEYRNEFLDLSKALQKVEKHSSEGAHENKPHHPVKLKSTLADLHSDIAEAIGVEDASTIKFAHEHTADGTIHLESDVHEIVAKADTKEKKKALAEVLTKHLDETTLSKFVDSEGNLKPAEQVERDTAATNSNGNGETKKGNWLATAGLVAASLGALVMSIFGISAANNAKKDLQTFQAGLMQQLQGFPSQVQALVQASKDDTVFALKAIGMAIRLGGGSPQQSAAPVKYASSNQVFNAPQQTLTDSSSVGGAPDAASASSDLAGIPPEIVAEINKIQDPTLKAETIATVKAQLERNKASTSQTSPVTSGTVAGSNTMPSNYTPVQAGNPLAGASPNQQAPYNPAGYNNTQLPQGYMPIPQGGLSTIPTDPGAAFLAGLNAAQKVGTSQVVQSPNGTPIAWNNRNG